MRKAKHDLRAAHVLVASDLDDYGAAAFHAQQCAEKVLKAYLVRHQVEFPKTHDIHRLRSLIASQFDELAQALADADSLAPYAVEFRYPSEIQDVPRETAMSAVDTAERTVNIVLEALSEYLAGGRPK